MAAPMHGLGSLEAGYVAPGSATTVPLSFNGTNLTVNVDCGGHGTLRVEVQDADGVPSQPVLHTGASDAYMGQRPRGPGALGRGHRWV